MAPAKHRMQAVLGLLFGLGLVALLGAVQMVTQGPGTVTAGQSAAWGRSFRSAAAVESGGAEQASLFPKRKPYNPHYDRRTRRAQERRRAMFWH